jgi:hypothetical protein
VLARARVRPNSTVLIGTSRIAAADDPRVWGQTLGTEPPVMLATEGEGSLPVLADLARDTTFRGHAVVEMMPTATYDPTAGRGGTLEEFLRAYREHLVSPAKRWEARLRVAIPSHFVFRRAEVLPSRLVPAFVAGEAPRPRHHALRADLFRPIDFRLDRIGPNRPEVLDTVRFQNIRRWGAPMSGAPLDSLFSVVGSEVAAIQRRGGRVTFILLEGCGGRKVIENRLYPRERYWNRLRAIPNVAMIDSDDYPTIVNLPCYDGSHIDARDAPAVTREIARAISDAINRRVGT